MRKKISKPSKAKTGIASPVSHALIQNQHGNILMSNYKFEKFYKALKSYLKSHHLPVSLQKLHYPIGKLDYCYGEIRIVYDVIKLTNNQLCSIIFLPHNKGIELDRIEMFNRCQGLGTKFMNAFVEISTNTNIAIYLVPGILSNNEHTSIKRLCGFYPRFGFKKLNLSRFWSNSYVNGKIRPNPYQIKIIRTQKLAS